MEQIKVKENIGCIEEFCVAESVVYDDIHSYFMETYNEKDMREANIDIYFAQDNQSMPIKSVLCSLHFQK